MAELGSSATKKNSKGLCGFNSQLLLGLIFFLGGGGGCVLLSG